MVWSCYGNRETVVVQRHLRTQIICLFAVVPKCGSILIYEFKYKQIKNQLFVF